MPARLVIAGTSARAGKTSLTSGLIGVLRRHGLRVQGFKVGPDYIDPSYHALASARPGRNLDVFLSGPELIAPLARHGAKGADIVVIEGVAGLFDGASGPGELASTAHVAKLLQAPVVLVVDTSAMTHSVAAIIHGYRTFDPELDLAGVILNRVCSDHHEQLLRNELEPLGIAVLGALRRDAALRAPERRLGLIPALERGRDTRAVLAALTAATERHIDLDRIVAVARAAPALPGPAWSPEQEHSPYGSARIAIARGHAFCCHYEENLELLRATGAQLLEFDPLHAEQLPAGAGALLLAGGFPELFGAQLEANEALRQAIATFATSRPILAECGGLLFLCRELAGHQMCGVLDASAQMTDSLTFGYREATAMRATPWLDVGERVRGHEFHYSQLRAGGLANAWLLVAGGRERPEGIVMGGVQASYLHVHWAAYPRLALRFAEAATIAAASTLAPAPHLSSTVR